MVSTLRKRILMLSICCAFAVGLIGCSGGESGGQTSSGNDSGVNATESGEIVLGSVSALSGHASFLGTELNKGSEAYFAKLNSEGGVNGLNIKLLKKDDKYEPKQTVVQVNEFIEESEIISFMNFVGTPTSKEILPLINESEIPVVGLLTGAGFLRDVGSNPYIFNIRQSYNNEVQKAVDYFMKMDAKKVAIMYQDDAFGEAILSSSNKALSKYNAELVEKATIVRGESPSAGEIDKIVQAKPDAVIMVGTSKNLAEVVKMATDGGLKDTYFYTVSFVGSEAYAKNLSDSAIESSDNIIVSQVVPSPLDTQNSIVSEYQETMKTNGITEFNYVSLEGYINAKIIAEALKRCKDNVTTGELINQLKTLNGFEVAKDLKVSLEENSNEMLTDVYLSKLVNGSFELF